MRGSTWIDLSIGRHRVNPRRPRSDKHAIGSRTSAHGWNNGPEYYSTIEFVDLNFDGKADVCGRSSTGIECALNTGSGFGPAYPTWSAFSDADGGNGQQYYSTIQFTHYFVTVFDPG